MDIRKNNFPRIFRRIENKLLKRFTGLLPCLLIAFIFGCAEPVIVKPDYNSPALQSKIKFEDSAPEVVNVTDKRGANENYAGSAQVGMLNTLVSYYLEEPVSTFVKKAVNKIIMNDKAGNIMVPVNVSVFEFKVHEKTFTFSEEGYFDCRLRFSYAVAKDSVYSVNTRTHQETSGMDVTNSLEGLIYRGIKECTEQFADAFKNNLPGDSINIENPQEMLPDSITEIGIPPEHSVSKLTMHNNSSSNIGMGYFQGSKIKTGAYFLYQQYSQMNESLGGGLGFALAYYDIENYDNMIKGSFFGLNFRYSLRYFLSESRNGLYFSGGLRLTFGNEKINYGNESKTNFFFGPTMEEAAGISLADRIFIEAGLFQIKYFGSDMLPADNGLSFSISIGY